MKAKRNEKTTNISKEDEALITALAVTLWNEYWDEVTQSGEDGKRPAKLYAEMYGVKENSQAAIMFQTFTGGLTKGMELYEKCFAGKEESQT